MTLKTSLKPYNPFLWIKKILPRTLFARSLLIIVIPVLLLQIVTTLVFVDNHWRKVTSRLAFSVAGEVAVIADELDKSYSEMRMREISDFSVQKLDLLVTFEPAAKIVPQTEVSGAWGVFAGEALEKALDSQLRRPYSLSFSPEDNWVNIGVQLDAGVLRVLVLERRLYSSSAYIFLLWVVGSSIILFAISVFFMRNQIRPIRRLALIAERMGTGREIGFFKPEGAREVRQAARAFIDMHQRITRQVEQRTAMLAGVSHDLRTPLTRMKLGLSLIGESEEIEDLKKDVVEMEKMVNSYLQFLRGDGEEGTEQVALIDLVERLAEQVRKNGREVSVDVPADLYMKVRPMAFSRCLQNLINNAEKYGKDIWIGASQDDDIVTITVDDNGPGLSADLFEDVFKPFFRADSSRNTATGGVGLGLPIVRDIAHAHGGEAYLEKSPHGGLRAVLVVPA